MVQEFITANPEISILTIAFLVTLVMTLVTKHFTDQNRMRELKKVQKACQIKLKDAKGNIEKQSKIQKQMMECSMELMKHSFKPMFITFIPIILLFSWVRGFYADIFASWLWWYLGGAIVSSIILRKALDVV